MYYFVIGIKFSKINTIFSIEAWYNSIFIRKKKEKEQVYEILFFSIFGVVFNYFSYKFVVSQPHGSSQRFSKSRYMSANILPLNVSLEY